MKNNSQDNFPKKLIYTFLTIYTVMLTGTMGLSFWQTIDNRINNTNNINKEIYQVIQNEIDRSYSRFMGIFNLVLGFTGVSAWFLRQSIISKIGSDITEESKNYFTNELNNLKLELDNKSQEIHIIYQKVYDQLQIKTNTEYILNIIPNNLFYEFKKEEESKTKNLYSQLKQISSNLEKLAEKEKDFMTFREWTALGNCFIILTIISQQTPYIQERIESNEVKEYANKGQKSYEKAISLQEDYKALFGLGYAHFMLGNYDESLKIYNKIIDLSKEISLNNNILANVHLNKGFNLRKKDDNEKEAILDAISEFDRATSLDEKLDLAWYNKACYYALLYALDKSNENSNKNAIEALKEAIKILPLKYKKLASKDSDFDSIRENEEFIALFN